ncbi:hypothetical protein MRB53_001120 [Persea americana]|uniref:Uncharacterized protein n=1 Tax=Persea americana TaxID=3435 RepID=A0ACC2MQS3_PERAE|nr:hypothetical protein MRB53_001120 [Persea americana]
MVALRILKNLRCSRFFQLRCPLWSFNSEKQRERNGWSMDDDFGVIKTKKLLSFCNRQHLDPAKVNTTLLRLLLSQRQGHSALLLLRRWLFSPCPLELWIQSGRSPRQVVFSRERQYGFQILQIGNCRPRVQICDLRLDLHQFVKGHSATV